MRILSVKLRNLNSLKGDCTIHFDEEPLLSSGLFAITGPTGSGKSTILDAIMLAIYGKTPRLGNISNTTVSESGGIVTLNCRDALAEVDYEIRGKKYRSNWSVSITKTGNANQPKMTLSDLFEDKILAAQKGEVVAKNTEIIGLESEQFTQSILLSQGKFMEFLNAKPKERAELLEKITGNWIFREIGKEVFDKHKNLNDEIIQVEARLGDINLLNEEEEAKLTGIISGLNLQAAELQVKITKIGNEISLLRQISQTDENIERIKKAQGDLAVRFTLFEQEKIRLQLHDKAIRLKPAMDSLLSQQKQLDFLTKKLGSLIKELDEANKSRDQLLDAGAILLGKKTSPTELPADLDELLQKVSDIDQKIGTEVVLSDQYTGNSQKAFRAFPPSLKKRTGAAEPTCAEAEALAEELRDEVKTIIVPKETTPDSIGDLIEEKRQELERFPALLAALKKHEELTSQFTSLNMEKGRLELAIPSLELEAKSLINDVELFEQTLVLIRDKIRFERDKLNFEEHRKLLKEGEACPLCGSTHHPFTAETGENPLNDLLVQEQETETRSKVNQKNQTAKSGELMVARRTLESIEEQLNSTTILFYQNKNLIKELPAIDGVDMTQSSDVVNNIFIQKKETADRLAAYQVKWNELSLVLAYGEIRKLKEESEDKKAELLKERNQLYQGDNISRDVSIIKTGLSTTNESIRGLTGQIKTFTISQKALADEILMAVNTLQASLELQGFTTMDLAWEALLSEEKELEIRETGEALEREKVGNEQSLKDMGQTRLEILEKLSLKGTLEELTTQYDCHVTESNVLREELGGHKKTSMQNLEKREQFRNIKCDLDQKRGTFRYYQILKELIGDKDGDKFNKIVQRFTLRHLLGLANKRLSGLTGRYQLLIREQGDTTQDKNLDQLMVIDQYQGDLLRSVETLSGGESFLVSMALALGLSDLAARNIKINSLFIDEGFGSLDPDTLDMAITTLEKLQAEDGKTIGIISHVDTLKERIVCQVKVNKGGNGYSTIEVE